MEVVVVPKTAYSITVGKPHVYTSKGESGRKKTGAFCMRCGSTVNLDVEMLPEMMLIMAGTLDDGSWFKPSLSLYCEAAEAWVAMPEDVKQFARMPETQKQGDENSG
jgi:hypothetical protein